MGSSVGPALGYSRRSQSGQRSIFLGRGPPLRLPSNSFPLELVQVVKLPLQAGNVFRSSPDFCQRSTNGQAPVAVSPARQLLYALLEALTVEILSHDESLSPPPKTLHLTQDATRCEQTLMMQSLKRGTRPRPRWVISDYEQGTLSVLESDS